MQKYFSKWDSIELVSKTKVLPYRTIYLQSREKDTYTLFRSSPMAAFT